MEHAPVTISWLTELGADLSDVGLMGGSSVKRTHRPQGGAAIGPHLMKILQTASKKDNVEIRTSNKVTGLLTSIDGSVTGVKVQNADGSSYTLNSKAVIIATGGFGANLDMVTRLQPSLSGFATLNHPGATGDALPSASPLTLRKAKKHRTKGLPVPGNFRKETTDRERKKENRYLRW